MKKETALINVLVVSSKYPPEYAGSGLRAHKTYKRMSGKFGFSYSVLSGSVIYNKVERYTYEGVSVYRIARKPFRRGLSAEEAGAESLSAGAIRKFKNGVNYIAEAALTWKYLLERGGEFDLIHVFGNNYVTAAAVTYAKIAKKPLIVEICNVSRKYSLYEPYIVKALFGRGLHERSKAVCISKRIESAYLASGYGSKVWCRPNPVDSSRFFVDREKKNIYRRKLGLFGEDDVLLVNIAKICPLKNQGFLLEVLKALPEKFKLFLGGPIARSGPYAERDSAYLKDLKDKMGKYDLDKRVRIEPRFIDNIDEYMKASDVYLLPSHIEACATPVLEALACGVPVVAHRIEGVTTEWIEEGKSGFLSQLDAPVFMEKIKKAVSLNNKTLYDRASHVKRTASFSALDEKYQIIIDGLLKKG